MRTGGKSTRASILKVSRQLQRKMVPFAHERNFGRSIKVKIHWACCFWSFGDGQDWLRIRFSWKLSFNWNNTCKKISIVHGRKKNTLGCFIFEPYGIRKMLEPVTRLKELSVMEVHIFSEILGGKFFSDRTKKLLSNEIFDVVYAGNVMLKKVSQKRFFFFKDLPLSLPSCGATQQEQTRHVWLLRPYRLSSFWTSHWTFR